MEKNLNIGIAGLGAIGRTHIERINNKLHGAKVVAATDAAREHGEKTAAQLGLAFFPEAEEMIANAGIDALMVTASDDRHERYVMAAVKAGMPVFCEKPLAPDVEGCKRIVDAEIAGGKKLVQVGYMRRYDPGYRRIKELLDSGRFGSALVVHCAHRNFEVPDSYDTPMAVSNSLVHEIDVLRWLIGEDYESVEVALPKRTRHAHKNLQDPQILVLHSKSGVRMDVEIFVNCRVGYDIQCEICCEEGFLKLPELASPEITTDASRIKPICRDWSERFIEAYNVEIQEWIDATKKGRVDGPNAWDGYIACVVVEFAHKARESQTRVRIELPEVPEFYK